MIEAPGAQLDKFRQAACELEANRAEARFDEEMQKLVKHAPVEKPE